MSIIKSSSPEFIALGARDLSGQTVPVDTVELPYHIPLFYLYTEKGPTSRIVCNGTSFESIFGKKTLDPSQPYFNHQTLFLEGALAENAAVVIQRVVGKNPGVRSNIVLYIDVLETNIVNYLRTSKGAFISNENSNDYQIDMNNPVIKGHRIKWVAEHITAGTEEALGNYIEKEGTMVDDQGNKSRMIPILEFRASNLGAAYNNIGFSLGSYMGTELNTTIKDKNKALPYKLTLFERDNELSSPKIITTLTGDNSCLVSLKEKATDPLSKAKITIESVFKSQWFDNSTRLPDFEGMYFYRDNFNEITKQFMSLEKDYISSVETIWADGRKASSMSWFDFVSDDPKSLVEEENYLINPFIGMSSKKVRYFTLQHDDGISTTNEFQEEVSMSFSTPIFLKGGQDGELSVDHYEKWIINDLAKYTDENSEYQDLAVNVESHFYDSGFGNDVKLAMADVLAIRKDTMPVLGTHFASLGQNYLPISDARTLASTLKTRLSIYPESTEYGTSVCRSMIVNNVYKIRSASTEDYVSLVYDIMIKTCKMMGQIGGWDAGYRFDRVYSEGIRGDNQGSLVTYGYDVKPNFIPKVTKESLWKTGLIWAQPYDLNSFYFPGLKTVYDDETSVLNNYFAACALSALLKINAKVARKYQGASFDHNNDVFCNNIKRDLDTATKNAFAGLYTVKNDVFMTDTDVSRGYSHQQVSKLYGSTMRTVAVHTTEVRRFEDLENEEI